MNLDEKCSEVMQARGWSQRQLADALSISDKNLISMRKGKRPMPAHALIKLERLRGTDDHSIIEQLLKTAACIALAVVLFFGSATENPAYASSSYAGVIDDSTNYRGFLKALLRRFLTRVRRLLLAARKHLPRPGRSRRIFIPA